MLGSTVLRDIKHKWNGWVMISGIGAIAALLPSLYILGGLFKKSNENWAHIKAYMLTDYILDSLYLVMGTVFFATIIGVGLAWLMVAYDFPLRRFFSFLFILPLAIPPYIAAYTYAYLLSYTGSFQVFMRNSLNVMIDQKYVDIMSMKGAIFIFTLFLYPYIYLITKSFLERNSSSFIENARLLGQKPLAIFFRIVLPLSQGAIVGGASLVAFEVLNDFGVAKHYGIQTFTVAIFKTWFGMYDVDSAIRLSAFLMIGIISIFIAERLLRSRRRYHITTQRGKPLQRQRLTGIKAGLVFAFSILISSLSFFIPVGQLLVWAIWTFQDIWNDEFVAMIRNTLLISFVSVSLLMMLAVIAANVNRLLRSRFTLMMSKMLSMGYSIPGAVLSIGVLAVFLALDNQLAGLYEAFGLGSHRLVLSMSILMLIFAYIIRFLAVGFNAVDAGYDKIGNQYSEASRTLGYGLTKTFFKVDFPMIRGTVLTGFILAFMEIVKELPLTLLLRPFNFDTLATKAYQYASDEQMYNAAVPSLLMIAFGIVSVSIYQWFGRREA